MANIEEDYVSFETSKLLKEKGFNEKCRGCYHCGFDDNDNLIVMLEEWTAQPYNNNFVDEGFLCSAPTLQMAMKWLRETHKLYINIWADPKDVESNDFDIMFRAQVYNGYSNYGTYEFYTYEEAAEIVIKYCLEYLI